MANLWWFLASPKEPLNLHINGNEPLIQQLYGCQKPNLPALEAAHPVSYRNSH
jgi:hypothetical protein